MKIEKTTCCTPIRIAFFDDRIDIESPGLMLLGMTIDDMKSGVSRIRNPVIARVFRELRVAEHWDSGIKRIFADAAAQRLPEPQIEELATGLRLRIFLAQAHVAGAQVAGSEPDSGHQTTASPTDSQLKSKLAAKVLLQLHAEPAGKAELAKALGHATVSGRP